ncbi:MAG TPA: sugar ABC transporter permease [Anaerolineales bacterium]|nr:sugar ABC transporter permease [Anaerolineales bacterium]
MQDVSVQEAKTRRAQIALEERTQARDRTASRVFLMPTVILILVLSIFPLIFSLVLAFMSWDLSRLEGGVRFVGLQNFRTLFADPRYWSTAKVTLIFVVCSVGLQYILGLGLALLLNQEIRGRRFFRVAFLVPMMLTPAAVGYVGRMLFNESQGPINDIIQALGGPLIPWLSNSRLALPSLILLDTWEWVPFMTIVLLAGLQSLPPEVFECARVDGAGDWTTLRYITLPMLAPVSITVILIRALEAFKLFDIVMVMTGGGPGTATETVTMYAYIVGMNNGNLGYASAIAYSLLIMVILFSTIFINSLRGRAAAAQG